MADLITLAPSRPTDWAGEISPGAKATFYLSGTTTPATVWQDVAGTIPHDSPIEADGAGVFPPIFSSASLKAIITDADDVELPGSPLDPCQRTLTSQSGASTIPFAPTEDIPVTDVQGAIERVQANQESGFEAAGVGVTTAPLLASIDATNLPSGRFRYDGDTAGTFPAGVTKADTGAVIISAGASGNQLMELTPVTGAIGYRRSMTALTWGAWAEVAVIPAASEGDIVYRTATGWGRLAKGSAGSVLRQNSGLTAPEWGLPVPTSGIGTLALLFRASAVTIGAVVPGSELKASGLSRAGDGVATVKNDGATQEGTWTALGSADSATGSLTLYVRTT